MLRGLPVLTTYPIMHLSNSVCALLWTESTSDWRTGPKHFPPILSTVVMERQKRWASVTSQRCCRTWRCRFLSCSAPIRPLKSCIMKVQDSPLLHCPTGLGEPRKLEHLDLDRQGENVKCIGCRDRGKWLPPWSKLLGWSVWWTERQDRGLCIVAGWIRARDGPHIGCDTLRRPRTVILDLGSVMRVWAAWAFSAQPFIQFLRREQTDMQVQRHYTVK